MNKKKETRLNEILAVVKEKEATVQTLQKEIEELGEEFSMIANAYQCKEIFDEMKKKSPELWFKHKLLTADSFQYLHFTRCEFTGHVDLIQGGAMYHFNYDKRVSFGYNNYTKVSVETEDSYRCETLERFESDYEPVTYAEVKKSVEDEAKKIIEKV